MTREAALFFHPGPGDKGWSWVVEGPETAQALVGEDRFLQN